MVEVHAAEAFLRAGRLAVVGASDDSKKFGGTIFRAMRDKGLDVVPVNPSADTVAGVTCWPDVAAVPGRLDGVVVVVNRRAALEVVRQCVDRGVPRVWLFKGIGGPGASSDEAVELCRSNGIDVVDGACPLMFLEPVGWFHRVHRSVRRARGDLVVTG